MVDSTSASPVLSSTGPARRTVLMGAIGVAATTGVVTGTATSAAAGEDAQDRGGRRRPLVIGHRGASGYRPEHTLASYELAARMGADFIEPDLCLTKDGALVARHEPNIGGTTDVASRPEFADRRTTKVVDGTTVADDWFVDDFTLAEIKTLRAIERLPQLRQQNTIYDGRYEVPTFEEVLSLRARLSRELRREIGVYPETKHPTWFAERGLLFAKPLLRALHRYGLGSSRSPVFVQSFELTNLVELRTDYRARIPLVYLLDDFFVTPADEVASGRGRTYGDFATPAGLAELARTVDGIGPFKLYVIPRDAAGNLGTPTTLVGDAHAAGLLVHPYTFRVENNYVPTDLKSSAVPSDYGDMVSEVRAYLDAGIDGFFTDNPDVGLVARDED